MARGSSNPGSKTVLEGFLVMLAVALLIGAAVGGFVLGRSTAPEGEGGAAAAEPQATETAETETGLTTITGTTETTETGETDATETEGGDDVSGAAVFAEAGCGSCHTFAPANSTGTVGPNLGETQLSKDEIAGVVRSGRNAMPSFEGRLTDEQIEAVADYVENG